MVEQSAIPLILNICSFSVQVITFCPVLFYLKLLIFFFFAGDVETGSGLTLMGRCRHTYVSMPDARAATLVPECVPHAHSASQSTVSVV